MFIRAISSFRVQALLRSLAPLPIVFLAFASSAQEYATNAAMILKPSTGVVVPLSVLGQINDVKDVEAYVVLPNQDELVVYDTVRDDGASVDFMDNRPHIAVIRGASLLLNVDSVSIASAGPVRFAGMALLPVKQDSPMMAFAFRLAVDQAGTFFVFVERTTRAYKVATTLEGAQAQLRFRGDSSGRFELWHADRPSSRNQDNQCVWCSMFYKTTSYQWTGGKLHRFGTGVSKHGYDPESFFESPLLLEK